MRYYGASAGARQQDLFPYPQLGENIPQNDLIEWRRHIHENSELSFQEVNTSKYVEDILKGLGNIEIIKPAKTSVVGAEIVTALQTIVSRSVPP